MQKPIGKLQNFIKELFSIQSLLSSSFLSTNKNELYYRFKKNKNFNTFKGDKTPVNYFNLTNLISDESNNNVQKISISIYEIDTEYYIEVDINPEKELLINWEQLSDHNVVFFFNKLIEYKSKIETSHFFNKTKLITEDVSADKISVLYLVNPISAVEINFNYFVYFFTNEFYAMKKEKIKNESDFRFLFEMLGDNYTKNNIKKRMEILSNIDVRLGFLTDNSKDLIELNYSY